MQGYASIGTIYYLREERSRKKLLFEVIENNSNDQTSTIMVTEDCREKGMKVKVNAKWLNEREPVGPILPVIGEIVIENGIEFVRPIEEKVQSKVLKP